MAPILLEAEPLRVAVDPNLGCAITEFSLDAPFGERAHILRPSPTLPAPQHALSSFIMAPWPNRIASATFGFGGQTHRLAPNNPDGTAIHGSARDHRFTITDRSPISLRCQLIRDTPPEGAFPFRYASVFRAELAPDALELDLSITNLDDVPMPAACGHHPYFNRRLLDDTDDVHIKAPVAKRYPTDNAIPTGPPGDDDLCGALRAGAPLADRQLDDLFMIDPGHIELTWPASRVRLTLDAPEPFGHLMLFAPRASTRPGTGLDAGPTPWFCVEPQTSTNDAFNAHTRGEPDTGVRVLEPGESLGTRLRMTIERLA